MNIIIDIENQDLLHRMWLPDLYLATRFKNEYNEMEQAKIQNNLTFEVNKKKYTITDISLKIDQAFLHYIEFNLIDKLPRQIENKYLGHTVVLTQLSDSSRQNVNLFLPPTQNTTDLVFCFLRSSDLNRNLGRDIFTTCKSLPPGLKEMSLTHTNNLNSSSELFANFHLKDLHVNKMNLSWINYCNYLVDNEYLDIESASNFFSCPKTRIDRKDSDVSTDVFGHSSACYYPITLTSYSDQSKPMISLQSAQVHYSALSLNLSFNTIPTDLSKYYVCVVYYNYYNLNFNLAHNDITLSPIVSNK